MLRRPLTSIELQQDDVEDMKSAILEAFSKQAEIEKQSGKQDDSLLHTSKPSAKPVVRCSSNIDNPEAFAPMEESTVNIVPQ